MVEEYR